MPNQQATDFARTVDALERGITVSMVMTADLETLGISEPVGAKLGLAGLEFIDCFPVRDDSSGDGRIVGAVYREDDPHLECTAAESMRPLAAVPIIGSRDSVDTLIRKMHQSEEHHWLVVHDAEICGIVTWSDLGRLPVQMAIFARLAHLENLMGGTIRQHFHDDEWVNCLDSDRQKRIRGLQRKARDREEELELLEYAGFRDKLDVCDKCGEIELKEGERESLIDLRNGVAHARDRSDRYEPIKDVLEAVHILDTVIEQFDRRESADVPAPAMGSAV